LTTILEVMEPGTIDGDRSCACCGKNLFAGRLQEILSRHPQTSFGREYDGVKTRVFVIIEWKKGDTVVSYETEILLLGD
jgi:hypothetical protein